MYQAARNRERKTDKIKERMVQMKKDEEEETLN